MASNEVRLRILNRDISQYEELVKTVTCSVADILYNHFLIEQKIISMATGAEVQITSEKVGDYSRNIANVSIDKLQELSSKAYLDKSIYNELLKSLAFTGLLCSGVRCVR